MSQVTICYTCEFTAGSTEVWGRRKAPVCLGIGRNLQTVFFVVCRIHYNVIVIPLSVSQVADIDTRRCLCCCVLVSVDVSILLSNKSNYASLLSGIFE